MEVSYAWKYEQRADKVITDLAEARIDENLRTNRQSVAAMVEEHSQWRRISSASGLLAIHFVKHSSPEVRPGLQVKEPDW